jgi:hypothetical protein
VSCRGQGVPDHLGEVTAERVEPVVAGQALAERLQLPEPDVRAVHPSAASSVRLLTPGR